MWMGLMYVCNAANVIQNVHIAHAGDNSRMAISWLTSQPTFTSMVFYGTSPSSLNMNATSTSQTSYDNNAGWNHNVVLTIMFVVIQLGLFLLLSNLLHYKVLLFLQLLLLMEILELIIQQIQSHN